MAEAAVARHYAIGKVPATVVLAGDGKDHRIRFYGFTGGYELSSLLDAILMLSTGESGLEPGIEAMVERITVPTHLEVMVTLTCPLVCAVSVTERSAVAAGSSGRCSSARGKGNVMSVALEGIEKRVASRRHGLAFALDDAEVTIGNLHAARGWLLGICNDLRRTSQRLA